MSVEKNFPLTSEREIPSLPVDQSTAQLALTLFFGLAKTLRMVGPNNDTYKAQCAKFWNAVQALSGEDRPFVIKKISGRYFVNESLCRFSHGVLPTGTEAQSHLWDAIRLGGIEIVRPAGVEGLNTLVSFMAGVDGAPTDPAALRQTLFQETLPGITLYSVAQVLEELNAHEHAGKRTAMRQNARSVFTKSLQYIGESHSQGIAGKEINVVQAKRTVYALVDHVTMDEASLLELASIRDFDDYTFAHSVNVCVYSITIGLGLGLDKQRLAELGFAALFHDIGKVRLPADLIRKTDTFDENDWRQMRRHPILGAKALLRTFPIDRTTIRAAIGALEHHMGVDGTGYPSKTKARPLNLFSRIIAIADVYDALTSGRIYIKTPIPPVEVIRKMLYQMGEKFDPVLLKLFVSAVGLYPPGTLVLLSTDEIAIVERTNSDALGKPMVRLIGERRGLYGTQAMIDLTEDTSREVIRILDPLIAGIDIGKYILSDTLVGDIEKTPSSNTAP